MMHYDIRRARRQSMTITNASATADTSALQRSRLRHLVIVANPSVDSFDHAIVETYRDAVRAQGQDVVVRDLYAIGFDPVLKLAERPGDIDQVPAEDVATELAFLHASDIVVLVYPIWYGLPPAILKGYVDRVLGANHSFGKVAAGEVQPSVAGKALLSFSTSGMPRSWLHAREQDDSLRQLFDVYLWRAFGMKQSEHVMIDAVTSSMTPQHVAALLKRVCTTADRTCAVLAGVLPPPWEA
jgi:NAD(P)H dehydrogenase (quinone)